MGKTNWKALVPCCPVKWLLAIVAAECLKYEQGPVLWLNRLIFHLQALASHTDTGSCLGCCTSDPTSCFMTWEGNREWPTVWVPCTHMRNLEEAPSF